MKVGSGDGYGETRPAGDRVVIEGRDGIYVVPVDLSAVLLVDRVGEDDPEGAEASVVDVVVPSPPFLFDPFFFFSASSFASLSCSFSCSRSESRMASIIINCEG